MRHQKCVCHVLWGKDLKGWMENIIQTEDAAEETALRTSPACLMCIFKDSSLAHVIHMH